MKNIKLLSLAMIALIGFNSCEDDTDKLAIVSSNASEASINLPQNGSALVLDAANPDGVATTVVWDEVEFNLPTAVSYRVQVDATGNDFANAVDAGATTETFLTWTHDQLNSVAVGTLGLPPFEPSNVDIRIASSIGANGAEESFSAPITITLTPYTTDLPRIFVVGNFLEASGYGSDWTPENAVPLSAPSFGATNFEGFVFMNVASPEFKILPTNTSFDGDYGDDGTFSGTLIQEGESNIQLGTGAGYYLINADTDALTYNAELTSWAITGSATPLGWPDGGIMDQDMTYNASTGKWEITIVLDASGEYKFRANDAWGLNLGTDDNADDSLDFNGQNFSVDATGTYLVELDLSNPRGYTQSVTLQ